MAKGENDSVQGRFGGTAKPGDGTWSITRDKAGHIILEMTDLAGSKIRSVMKPEEVQSILIALTNTMTKSQIRPSPKTACSCEVCWVCWRYGTSLNDKYDEE